MAQLVEHPLSEWEALGFYPARSYLRLSKLLLAALFLAVNIDCSIVTRMGLIVVPYMCMCLRCDTAARWYNKRVSVSITSRHYHYMTERLLNDVKPLLTYEPAHDNTYKKKCATNKESDQPVHLSSQRVFADLMCLLQPPGYPERWMRTLAILGGFESWLVTKVLL